MKVTVDVGETRLFADHDVVGPLVVRMAVRGGAQDEQLAITMGGERTVEEPTGQRRPQAEQQGVAQEHGCDVACPGRVTVDPLEEVGMLRLELVGGQRWDARSGH